MTRAKLDEIVNEIRNEQIVLFNKQRSSLSKYVNPKCTDPYPYQYDDQWYVVLGELMDEELIEETDVRRLRCQLYHDIDEIFGTLALYSDLSEEFKKRVNKTMNVKTFKTVEERLSDLKRFVANQ